MRSEVLLKKVALFTYMYVHNLLPILFVLIVANPPHVTSEYTCKWLFLPHGSHDQMRWLLVECAVSRAPISCNPRLILGPLSYTNSKACNNHTNVTIDLGEPTHALVFFVGCLNPCLQGRSVTIGMPTKPDDISLPISTIWALQGWQHSCIIIHQQNSCYSLNMVKRAWREHLLVPDFSRNTFRNITRGNEQF